MSTFLRRRLQPTTRSSTASPGAATQVSAPTWRSRAAAWSIRCHRALHHTKHQYPSTSQAVYEPAYGNNYQSTDASSLVSNFAYDGLGRLAKATGPTGAVSTKKYEWYLYTSNVTFPPQQRYALKISARRKREQGAVYFDRNGNRLKTESSGFGALW